MRIVVVDHPPGVEARDFAPLAECGDLRVFARSDLAQLMERLAYAEVVISFSTPIRRELLDYLPRLRVVVLAQLTSQPPAASLVERPIAAQLGVHVIECRGDVIEQLVDRIAAHIGKAREY